MSCREENDRVILATVIVAVLNSEVYQDMRWCAKCGGQKIFVEVYEFDSGRVGVCLGCGDERVVRFSRVNSGAA